MVTPLSVRFDIGEVASELSVTADELARRKAWLEFGSDDVARLREINELASESADEVIEDLYEHLLAYPETSKFFEDPALLDDVKRMQHAYFLRLTQGEYDEGYVNEQLKMDAVHQHIGLDVKWYLGAYSRYLRAVGERIMSAYKGEPERAMEYYDSLKKLVFFDIGLAIDTYIFERESTIKKQQEAIRKLSTPVLQVREGLLILPIVGIIDAQRAGQLTEQLLQSIRTTRGKVVVIDITGVPSVDAQVANHLVQTAEASRLMGATVVVTGLSAEVAQTLVMLGLDLTMLNTVADLQGGIEVADRILGYQTTTNRNGSGSSSSHEA
jgi:rsbT co-antagonist protein RsbR